MSQKIRCANPKCRRLFLPDPRVETQAYCSRKDCQRLRKRRWQREKMKTDRDYRLNQKESHQCWREQNRDYYRRYRAKNPEYVERNRLQQRGRDQRLGDNLAKMDALNSCYPVTPGTYYLIPAKGDLAKMDAISGKYFLIPSAYPFLAKKDLIDFRPFSGLGCAPKEDAAHDRESHRSSRSDS
jgi:hypothetical protein